MNKLFRLKKIIISLRQQEHFRNDDDPYFSCPKHPESLSPEKECNCNFEYNHERTDLALRLIDELMEGEK